MHRDWLDDPERFSITAASFIQNSVMVLAEDHRPTLSWYIQGGPKSKPLPYDQKIVSKPVNEIRFIRQLKVWIKHYNIIF